MDRVLTVFLVLVLVCCEISGCQSNTAVVENEGWTDYDSRMVGGSCMFAETEKSYYFVADTFQTCLLRRYDKSTKKCSIFCDDKKCSHDSDGCSAYLPGAFFGLSFYGGNLYWVGSASAQIEDWNHLVLWKMDPNTKEKTVAKELDYDTLCSTYNVQRFDLHQGKLYAVCALSNDVDEVRSTIITLLSSSIEGEDGFEVCFEENYDDLAGVNVKYCENKIYMVINHVWTEIFTARNNNGPEREYYRPHYFAEAFCYDASIGETEKIFGREDCPEELYVRDFIPVTQESGALTELVLASNDEETGLVYRYKDGAFSEWYRFGKEESATENGAAYKTVLTTPDSIFAVSKQGTNDYRIWIIDLNGDTVYQGSLPLSHMDEREGKLKERNITFLGGDKENFYFGILEIMEGSSQKQKESDGSLYYYEMQYVLENGEIQETVLWESGEIVQDHTGEPWR